MGGGGAFGQKPPPRCCYSPRFGSKATSGILPAKAAAGFGILPPKAGLFNPGKRARAEPGFPPPPGAAAARPTARRGGRTPSGLGAGGFVPLVGEGRGSDPAALRRYRFPRGGKKKKKQEEKGMGRSPQRDRRGWVPGPEGRRGARFSPRCMEESSRWVGGRCGRRKDGEGRVVETPQPSFYFFLKDFPSFNTLFQHVLGASETVSSSLGDAGRRETPSVPAVGAPGRSCRSRCRAYGPTPRARTGTTRSPLAGAHLRPPPRVFCSTGSPRSPPPGRH